MKKQIEKAAEILKETLSVAVLTGAGVSAESNIPTYRDADGLWNQFQAQDLATLEAFSKNPATVWEWYSYRQQLMLKCEPNPGHKIFVEMEKYFPEFTLITQNIDGLHQRAGSKDVVELHGNVMKARCMKEEEKVFDFIAGDNYLPKCEDCGSLIRPHVVWFGEMLDSEVIGKATSAAANCEVFIMSGTSAVVYPAAGLPLIAIRNGAKLIEINLEETPVSDYAEISIRGKSGEILPEIWKLVKGDK
ncbi:MAG: NAD-dependent deacylase [Firmicutes bacterium]|nr:NAD-dependent deacylase [Bacillota bacterium]